MSETIYSPFAASGALETFVPSEEDFVVNTQLLGMPSQPTTQAPASPRVDSQFRTYAPPPAGSFDPYTAGITGGIPSFFSYREPAPPPPVPTPGTSLSDLGDTGGGGGDGGGLGSGNVNMGGQMAGSIDVGPNPGTMDRGFGQAAYGQLGQTLGTLGSMATGVPGLGIGLGALGTLADVQALNAELGMMGLPQDIAFGPSLAANLSYGMLGTPAAAQFGNIMGFQALAEAPLSAFAAPALSASQNAGPSSAMADAVAAAATATTTPADVAAEQAAISEAVAAAAEAEAAAQADAAQAEANAAAAQADADAQADAAAADAAAADADGAAGSDGEGDGGDGDGGDGGDGGGGDGGGGDGGGGDGGYYQGGLVQFAGGGLVPLAGGGKIAIGPGGGLDDLIPTSINGRRAAALSDGEFVIPADVVSMMGDGSSNAGARRLYDLVKQVRDVKTGTTKQAGPLPVGDILKRSMGR